MPLVTFIDHLGAIRQVQAESGRSLMEAARDHGIPGIDANCGGMCACATCHIYIDDAFIDRVPSAGDQELPMLEFLDDRTPGSRLACQIELTDDLDGLVVRTPESQ